MIFCSWGRRPIANGVNSQRLVKVWRRRRVYSKVMTTFVRGILITGGAVVAGIAQFYTWPVGAQPTGAQITGIAGTVVAALGGLWMIVTEHGTEEELALASVAIEEARAIRTSSQELQDSVIRQNSSYQVGRTVAETIDAMLGGFGTDISLAASLLQTAARDLSIAAGFRQADVWSIAIYQARNDGDGKKELVLVAAERALKGALGNARSWPQGEGVPGIANQQRYPLSIPDIHDPATGGLFEPSPARRRSYDANRYRAVLAVPIKVAAGDDNWGVLVATSDVPRHFVADSNRAVQYDRPILDFANLIALVLRTRLKLGDQDDDLSPKPDGGHG